MTSACIVGLSVRGGFGSGAQALLSACARSAEEAAGDLIDTTGLTQYLPTRALRRMDYFTRLALLGAFEALVDADLAPGGADMDGLGIVFATGIGPARLTFDFLDGILDHGPDLASPQAFSLSVQNIPAATIALHCGIKGPVCTVCQFDTSVAAGLATALSWLGEGRCRTVLFGAVDERTNVDDAYLEVLAQAGNSLSCAEGAVFLVLRPDGAERYGRILSARVVAGERLVPVQTSPLLLSGRKVETRLADHIRQGINASHYTSVYGDLPVAQAFDVAFAALTGRKMRCLSADGQGHCGVVDVEPGGGSGSA